MKRQNYDEYLRLKREAKYLVQYGMMLVKNWNACDTGSDMDFIDAVVGTLGSEKEYEQFIKCEMEGGCTLYRNKMSNETVIASK